MTSADGINWQPVVAGDASEWTAVTSVETQLNAVAVARLGTNRVQTSL
jgi:hypothetical protein